MFQMHSIKSQARRHAWAQGEDGAGKWNPFARKPAKRTATTDPEVGEKSTTTQHVHGTDPSGDYPTNSKVENANSPTDNNLTQRRPVEGNESQDSITSANRNTKEGAQDEGGDTKKPSALKKKIPIGQQIKNTLFPHWYTINWLIIAAPVGIGMHFVKGVNPLAVFVINFIAIIPLAGLLSFATEEIALRVGEVLGGLLNASFGNAVELIVGIIALAKKKIIIVQTSLIGSILSNLLLVMGMCFFFGGVNRIEQFFNHTVALTAASLLALAVGSLIIPTAYTWGTNFNANESNRDEELSRGTAIIILLVYACYLIFQLKSHKKMYNAPSQKVAKRKPAKDTKKAFAHMGGFAGAHTGGRVQHDQKTANEEREEEEEQPTLSLVGAIVTLCLSTALIGVCAEFIVDSITEVTCTYHVSQVFIGLILLPIVGNAAEHATAVTVAIKDKMDLAIGVAVGSSMQIALFVLPLMVVIGWIIHADMTLVFDDFQIAVLFVAVILINYLIADGKSHWLEGVLLMALYVIIAVAAYFYPQTDATSCEA